MPDEKKQGEMPQETEETTGTETTPTTETNKPTLESTLAEVERLRSELKKRNGEEAARRKKLEALETEAQKRKEADMSELQKAQSHAQELETKLADYESEMQELRLRHAIERAAGAMKFINPEEAYKLADLSAIEFDEEGKLDAEAIDTALKALAKRSPYLLEQGETQPKEKKAPDIGATPGRAGTGVNKDQLTEEKQQELIRRYRMNV